MRIKSEEEIIENLKTLKVSPANKPHIRQECPANPNAGQPGKPLGSGIGSDYPSKQFSNFFNANAKAINTAYRRTCSLFQHPFGRVVIASERQFWNVIAYIHQNPQKHKFVDDFRDWKYSSYGILISDKLTKIQREIVLDWFGGKQAYLDWHAEWVTEANSRGFAENDDD